MHLDDERIQRLLHRELESSVELGVRQHLAGCTDCRVLVDEADADERRIFGLLAELDHPLPVADLNAVLAARRTPRTGWGSWAAGLLLVAAAGGAAYAAPGSPLPAILDRLIAWAGPTETPAVPMVPADRRAAPGAGIAVAPGERLTIHLTGELDGAQATVSLTDAENVVVRAEDGSVAFSSDVDRLSVHSTGPAHFEILIPRSAPSVHVLVEETPVFRLDSSRVITRSPPDAGGRYTLPLSGLHP